MQELEKINILYVEDDETLAFVTKDHLELKGYHITHCKDGEQAINCFEGSKFDLCLLDVMLPKKDGFELAKEIRHIDPAVPILFLTAKSLKEDRLQGFEIGGDDYITKPFSIEELIMKINVFLRRRQVSGVKSPSKELEIGKFKLHPGELLLEKGSFKKQLTQKECDVLVYFATRPNTLITRTEILKEVWGQDDYFMGRSMDVFISKIRKYLSGDPEIRIQNVHGVGFKLEVG